MKLIGQFDTDGYQSRFANKGRIRVEGALGAEVAENVHLALEQQTPWALQLVNAQGAPEEISRSELDSLPPSVIQTRLQAAAQRAQENFSYLRLGFHDYDSLEGDHDVKALANLIASPEFTAFCHNLTGLSGLELQGLSCVCYRPGDFLTRHTDSSARLMFEWNFTKAWRSDWGGQVLFHSPSGDIEGGIMPRLDDLALYSGDQPRSIASIAPYAGGPRFSLTGRFF
jgi:SM-20-related protein